MPLIAADLQLKHDRMSSGAFAFLRATFYRWVQLWQRGCPELASAPLVLGVGDLHVENFGTWRDSEGRLIWGVNDFDEACWLPYPNDLVRLCASAQLAATENDTGCGLNQICEAVLEGYTTGLKEGGRSFVLAESHRWLRTLATGELREPARFWMKLTDLKTLKSSVPRGVKLALAQALPELGTSFRIVHRQAGLGSLGRRRFVGLADWRGGLVAREAKELAPSAWNWQQRRDDPDLLYQQIISRAVRVPDPCLRLHGNWLIRRLAPDCSRIELASLPKVKDELKLLQAMGWETANIHLGTKSAVAPILKDLERRPKNWLIKAVSAMAKVTTSEWSHWRDGY